MCRTHGERPEGADAYAEPTTPWKGAIRCTFCMRTYLCEEIDGKWVYSRCTADGLCACGSTLFPKVGGDAGSTDDGEGHTFTAQPKCTECAKVLWARQQPASETPDGPT